MQQSILRNELELIFGGFGGQLFCRQNILLSHHRDTLYVHLCMCVCVCVFRHTLYGFGG